MYTHKVGRFLVIYISNQNYIAKIIQEHPLLVIIDDNGSSKTQTDFVVIKDTTKEIQTMGLEKFLLKEMENGATYPSLLKEVANIYPKQAPVIIADIKPEKKIVPTAPTKTDSVTRPIVPIIKKGTGVIEIESEPENPFLKTGEITIDIPVISEIKKPSVTKKIITKKSLPVVKKENSQKPKVVYDKKVLGELYFQIYHSLSKATGMKIGSDFTLNHQTPTIVFVPSKSKGKFSCEKRMELAWVFFKEKYCKDASRPYFFIDLPENMPADVIILDVTDEYQRHLVK